MEASGLLEIEEARRLVLAEARVLAPEEVELADALDRVLGEEVTALQPVPAYDGSAMDGFAARAGDLLGAGEQSPVSLRVVDESRAGAPALARVERGEAIAISTGAVLPLGADTVVRVEDTRVRGDHVEVLVAAPAGRDIRHAGGDVSAGQAVLGPGSALGPAELGVLASLGRPQVLCTRRPRVSLLTSGDELLGSADEPREGAVRDSNALSLGALVQRAGAELVRSARVGDDAPATRQALAEALAGVDVAVICGGVSVGAHDHVRPALAALGARTVFWGVALKPGRPTWFGTLEETLVFGLPGNPVSAMVTFILLVRPALRALLGLAPLATPMSAVMEHAYEKPRGRAHALRCTLRVAEDGWHAQSTGAQDSHILTSMLAADALALIPADTVMVRAGERVSIAPLRFCGEPL